MKKEKKLVDNYRSGRLTKPKQLKTERKRRQNKTTSRSFVDRMSNEAARERR
jgi:hypothetical protein